MLSQEEIEDIAALWKKLQDYRIANAVKASYYEAKRTVKDLGISIPPSLKGVQESIGWPKIGVDALNERICFEGWQTDVLNDVYDANHLDELSTMVTLDALRYGIGFILVGEGDELNGEPPILITAESPNNVSSNYSMRKRRLTSAIKVIHQGKETWGVYFTDTYTVPFLIKDGHILGIEDEERKKHKLGRLPIVQLLNRPDSDNYKGHSEITEAVISLVNSMMRSMLGMEVAREFYAAPQRYILGADPEHFMDGDGNPVSAMSVLMDKVQILPPTETGAGNPIIPTVGQFATNSPDAFLEPMRFYAQLFSAEACIPENYLGFNTVNPTSADAIRASESRLIKKAEQRIASFRRAWIEVAQIIRLLLEEEIEDFDPTPIFGNPATPTRAAAADEVTKLISTGMIAADSDIALRRIGFTRKEREQILSENGARTSSILARALAGQGEGNVVGNPLTGEG